MKAPISWRAVFGDRTCLCAGHFFAGPRSCEPQRLREIIGARVNELAGTRAFRSLAMNAMPIDDFTRHALLLGKIKHELHQVTCAMERLCERLDKLNYAIIEAESRLPTPAAAAGLSLLPMAPARSEAVEQILLSAAQRGAAQVKFRPQPDGSVHADIDAQKVELSPRLAGLMEILVANHGQNTDEFVGWKSRQEVREWLSKLDGRKVSKHALNNLVSRLRKELRRQASLHRNFIQVNHRLGLRFALRRPLSDVSP